jgi:hypothetical protein
MITIKDHRTLLTAMCALAALILLAAGCSVLPQNKEGPTPKDATKKNEQTPIYYEFEDVLIPKELKVERDESFIYQTAGVSAGLMTLKARVEIGSLITFFEKNMRKDNWRLISSFKSGRSMMLFQKENRWCVMNIAQSGFDYSTRVEIWVAPTVGDAQSGLLQ